MKIVPNACGNDAIYVPAPDPCEEGCELQIKTATQNGTLYPDEGYDGLRYANINVPNSYAAADEGKVVDNGALVAQGSQTITQNGTYDTTLINELIANISGGGGGSTNILSGTDWPTANIGEDGNVYLKYDEASIRPLGDEYINTGYVFNANTEIHAIIKVHKNRTNSYQFVFGSRNQSGIYPQLGFSVRDNGTWRGRVVYGNSYTKAFTSFPYEEIVELNITPSEASYTALAQSETIATGSSNGTQPIYLFGFREGTTDSGHYSDIDLYEFSIYETGVLIKNFVPHIDENEIACLLETISGDLYYGAKTSGFSYTESGFIASAHCKVNGVWQDLIGTNIDDVNTGA